MTHSVMHHSLLITMAMELVQEKNYVTYLGILRLNLNEKELLDTT